MREVVPTLRPDQEEVDKRNYGNNKVSPGVPARERKKKEKARCFSVFHPCSTLAGEEQSTEDSSSVIPLRETGKVRRSTARIRRSRRSTGIRQNERSEQIERWTTAWIEGEAICRSLAVQSQRTPSLPESSYGRFACSCQARSLEVQVM